MSELPQTDADEEPAPRCMNLTCKAMQVYGEDFEQDPDYEAGMTDFWCVRTGQPDGPDGQEASMETCCDRERECYREF